MEPQRRRRWALLLIVEALLVCAATGWVLARVADDDGPVWICAGLAAAWFISWMACIAVRPTAARHVAAISGAVVGVLLIALVAVAACSGSTHRADGPCRAADLTAEMGRLGVAMGHWSQDLVFTNHGEECRLAGVATIEGRTPEGGWEPLKFGTGEGPVPPPPPAGPLANGESARLLLQGTNPSNYDPSDDRDGCPTPAGGDLRYLALRVSLPDEAGTVEVDEPFNTGCDLTVTAFGELATSQPS
jgi:hypothetical protein